MSVLQQDKVAAFLGHSVYLISSIM